MPKLRTFATAEAMAVSSLCRLAAHSLTAYDRQQSTRKSYNPNALAAYLAVVEKARGCADLDTARAMLLAGFIPGSPMHTRMAKL